MPPLPVLGGEDMIRTVAFCWIALDIGFLMGCWWAAWVETHGG